MCPKILPWPALPTLVAPLYLPFGKMFGSKLCLLSSYYFLVIPSPTLFSQIYSLQHSILQVLANIYSWVTTVTIVSYVQLALEKCRLNWAGPHIHRYFSVDTYPLLLKHCLESADKRAENRHWSTSFIWGTWASADFSTHGGPRTRRYWGTTKFRGIKLTS